MKYKNLRGIWGFLMISLIIPVYNGGAYLDKCIQSILNQSYRDFELILVDDCSHDNSLEICNRYAKKDDRIKITSNKVTSGTAKTRNMGLNLAAGEFIVFIDHDDFIDVDYLKILYEKQQYYDADIVQCRFVKFTNEDSIEYPVVEKDDIIYNNIVALRTLFEDHSVQSCVVFNKIYKRFLFETIRFDDGKVHEDTFIMHRIFHLAEKVVFIDNVLYHYRKAPGSITMKQYNKTRLDELEALQARAHFLKKVDYELYILSLIQLAEGQVNQYYNMKKYLPHESEELYLIRSNFKRYFKIIKKHKNLMTEKNKINITYFNYFPRLFYMIKYKNCLDYFVET